MTDDIAAWLTAIWDEDEKGALAAAGPYGPDWGTSENSDDVYSESGGYVACGAYGYMEEGIRYFVAHQDPAATLARIAADRQILAECSIVLEDKDPTRVRERMLAWAVLRHLASVHRDRPNWREAWQ